MNKKGLEDTLFTWVGAFFVLIFFVLIYFGILFLMFGDKKVFGDGKISIESGNDLIVIENFRNFLDSEVKFEDSKVLVKELVGFGDNGLKEFRKLGSEFVDRLNEKKVWLRVYDAGEDVRVDFNGKYKDYDVSRNVIVYDGRGSWSLLANKKKEVLCNPENLDGFLFFGFSLDKKIALCWENE